MPQDRVNFPALISNYSLDEAHPGLPLMAETVRKAEKVGWTKDGTEHYGLWAIANGVYTLVNGDDPGMVQGMMPVYDALYAYCKLRAEGKSGWTSDAS